MDWLSLRRRDDRLERVEEDPDATIERLLERVDEDPWDLEASFDLGVQLTEEGHAEHGLRHLDRTFKYDPAAILRLLADPALEPVRTHPLVDRLLRKHHAALSRRLHTAYA